MPSLKGWDASGLDCSTSSVASSSHDESPRGGSNGSYNEEHNVENNNNNNIAPDSKEKESIIQSNDAQTTLHHNNSSTSPFSFKNITRRLSCGKRTPHGVGNNMQARNGRKASLEEGAADSNYDMDNIEDCPTPVQEEAVEDCEALLWDAQMALISHQYQTAVSLLSKAAQAGSSTACLSLANIYLKGLPCTNHDHRKHSSISPSKLIEGSISIDNSKTTSYLLQALELEGVKSSFSELDLEVLADASTLLCNLYRFGKIRPNGSSSSNITKSPVALSISKELPTSPQPLSSESSYITSSPEEEILSSPPNARAANHQETAWSKGGRVARPIVDIIESALKEEGFDITSSEKEALHKTNGGTTTATKGKLPSIFTSDAILEQVHSILVRLHYVLALVEASSEDPDAMKDCIQAWRRLLSCHRAFEEIPSPSHQDNNNSKNSNNNKKKKQKNQNGLTRKPSKDHSSLDELIVKAEKRLELLLQAEEKLKDDDGDNNKARMVVRPRDLMLRRDTSDENGSSSLFSPISEKSLQLGSISTTSSSIGDISPNSLLPQTSDISMDESLCSCQLPAPLAKNASTPKKQAAPVASKQKVGGAKFALHESPSSIRSYTALPDAGTSKDNKLPFPSASAMRPDLKHTASSRTIAPGLFKGFQNGRNSSSRNNLADSWAGPSDISSLSSKVDVSSLLDEYTTTGGSPSKRFLRGGGAGPCHRRPLLDRKSSSLSLASITTFGGGGRKGWGATSTVQPFSRSSNLSSASLFTLAPTTDLRAGSASVLSLPHFNREKNLSGASTATQMLSSMRAGPSRLQNETRSSSSSSSSSPAVHANGAGYNGKIRNAFSSLSNFFTVPILKEDVQEESKALSKLEELASKHDEELDGQIWWEDDRTSSEEESLHSGSPSDYNHDDDDEAATANTTPHSRESSAGENITQEQHTGADISRKSTLSKSMSSHASKRPPMNFSTSISSSYLHSPLATSINNTSRRGELPHFVPAPGAAEPSASSTSQNNVDVVTSKSINPVTKDQHLRSSLRQSSSSKFTNGTYNAAKIDPLLASLEASSRVNVKSRCAVCGIQGVNFPKCHRCEMTFCSRDCRMASGGDAGKHVCPRVT